MRDRFSTIGITQSFLQSIHTYAFAFDFNDYVERLTWRCESYLNDKNEKTNVDERAAVLAQRLLRMFPKLSPDAEFRRVLSNAKATGTRADYERRMSESFNRIESTPVVKEFDKLAFSRQYLKEFIERDPYVRTAEDWEFESGSGSQDLDQTYHIGLTIFASDANVAVDFEFTELAPSQEPIEQSEVESWIIEMQEDLALRSQMAGKVFGSLIPRILNQALLPTH